MKINNEDVFITVGVMDKKGKIKRGSRTDRMKLWSFMGLIKPDVHRPENEPIPSWYKRIFMTKEQLTNLWDGGFEKGRVMGNWEAYFDASTKIVSHAKAIQTKKGKKR